MRNRSWLLATVILCAALGAGATAWYAIAQVDTPSDLVLTPADRTSSTDAETPKAVNPVVAVIPYRSETEFEPDPFEPDRMRSSRTEVKELILIRADGTIEHKRAW